MRTYSSVFIVVIVVEVVIEVNASLERYVRLSCSLIIQKEAHLIAMKDSTRKRRALTEYQDRDSENESICRLVVEVSET